MKEGKPFEKELSLMLPAITIRKLYALSQKKDKTINEIIVEMVDKNA
jgi:hypothetical protein